ncbi:hypothetical protein [Streptomyces sp. NPDC056948]|uniref:hypothetical protein n=1 Tax=Streptomyces sp. NPDC056948 TaxID=3345975 RepID=UPI00363B805A
MINVRGRLHDLGPRLGHAPAEVVHAGRRRPLGGRDLPRHRPLHEPEPRGRTPACRCAPERCRAEVPAKPAERLS